MRLKICLVIAVLATLAVPLVAQQPATAQPAAPAAGMLEIVVIEGEGARNNIRARSAVAPVVEVRDASGNPVAGAEVLFQLPLVGPSGVFNGWVKTQTVRTNEQGRAQASGYTPNQEEGRFNIKVTATAAGRTGSVVIAQSNVTGSGGAGAQAGGRSGWWKALAVIGAGAAVAGIVLASRDDDTPVAAVTNPVTITTGPITVAGPR